MKNLESIPMHQTTIHTKRRDSRSGRDPLWPWWLGICGLAFVIGGAFFVQARHSNKNGSAATKVIAPTVAGVSMRNVQFEPVTLEIMKGTVVEWKNDDLVPHTATSPSFDSGAMASGQSWRHTFIEIGNFPYSCAFHPHMKGVVIVK